jgi:hypothetical protein
VIDVMAGMMAESEACRPPPAYAPQGEVIDASCTFQPTLNFCLAASEGCRPQSGTGSFPHDSVDMAAMTTKKKQVCNTQKTRLPRASTGSLKKNK